MTKIVEIAIDIKKARKVLCRDAGFTWSEIQNATDGEVFEKVLALYKYYGITYKIPSERRGRWIRTDHMIPTCKCSLCFGKVLEENAKKYDYCPYCKAEMEMEL